MKRKILITIPTLNSGGVEVSLIRFLKTFSKRDDVEFTLLLLKKEGMYLKDVPHNVKVIEISYENNIYNYYNSKEDILKTNSIINKIKFVIFRLNLRVAKQIGNYKSYYNKILKHLNKIDEEYDLAIDWHGYGHFTTAVVADYINAKKKIMWIHDEKNSWFKNIIYCLDKFNKIFCVGKACRTSLLKEYPQVENKTDIFYNLIDVNEIQKKASEKLDTNFNKDICNIVTIGRLEWQKGYDIALECAKIMKKRKFDYCWRIIGGGSEKNNLIKYVEENDLSNNIIFLGVTENPFPYVKESSLYVLTSRHEGYCLSTLEAKVLGKIIIATNIESNREQIRNEFNGLLCELNPEEFADAIIKIYNDKKLQTIIRDNLQNENFDFSNQFDKLLNLMGGK